MTVSDRSTGIVIAVLECAFCAWGIATFGGAGAVVFGAVCLPAGLCGVLLWRDEGA